MASKLGDNGIYEGSRIILPEHREAYLAQMEEQKRRGKPELDDQEVQQIERLLVESYNSRCTIDLVVFNPFYDEPVSGVVIGLNVGRREVKLMLDEEFRWISLAEIISANV
ncbi:YolD-like family protein [Paenibacillus sp. DCT19]|uniref:YolD-like family protein n=1 Tax=Paenibacillus sp. DCT19 TaxID=2211212 RepID=UPI000FE270F9|nr:YolD-like family protein [Paenibacillus sp. DCT19]